VKPGERIAIRPLPGGRIEVSAAGPTGSIEEIQEADAAGWADMRTPIHSVGQILTFR
jgi:hypothetical protein